MWNECKDLQEYIVGLRRDLHQIPELGLHLPETAAYVTAELDKIGIPYICSKKDSGIIATIKGGKPGKTICLRADMDALPIKEETGLPFASRHEGFMHACGHDTHTAMLLGAGKVLWAHKDEIAQATAAVFGGNVDYEMIWGAPPVINDDKMAALAAKAAKTVAGEDHVITEVKAPNMGGEDFAYYLEKLPGAFMFLSSSNPAKGTDVSHHNPKFDVDEDVLWEGSAVFVAIVEEFLNK